MTDKELINQIKNKKEPAFKELINKYQPMVLNTCYSFLHDKTNAEDITQEVFIEVYLSINKFNQKAKLSTWIYRIAVNKSLNFIRNNKKRNIIKSIENFFSEDKNKELQIADDTQSGFDKEIEHQKRLDLLHKAIDNLKRKQKIAFTLNKLENQSYEQVAEIMDLSIPAVEGLIHRAKLNVQKEILKILKKKS